MKKILKRAFFLLIIFLALFFCRDFILEGLAKRLIVSDTLEKADVIIVLAGDSNGERAEEGIRLFKKGFAPKLLMSGGPLAWRLTQAEWMKKQAVAGGVPAKAILLQDKSRSTIDDAKFSLPIVQKNNFKSVILVTSPYHTRRAKNVFVKIFRPYGVKILIHPAGGSDFNANKWWRRHEDTGYVVWEYASSIQYFLKGYWF